MVVSLKLLFEHNRKFALSRNSCIFSAGESNNKENLHPPSVCVTQRVKGKVTEVCVSSCRKDIRPFNIVSDSGFVDYSKTLSGGRTKAWHKDSEHVL
jgi:Fe-S-cluster-containing dehydrogenase component